MSLNPAQAFTLCRVAPAQDMVMLLGEPGAGKSSVIRQAVASMDADYWGLYCATMEAVETRGLPAVQELNGNRIATWLPFENVLPLKRDSAKYQGRTIAVNMDDLMHGNNSVVKALIRSIYGDGSARFIGQQELYPNLRLFATANLHTQRAGSARMETYAANRVCRIEVHPPTGREWLRASGDGTFALPEPDAEYAKLRERIDEEVAKGIPLTLAAFVQWAYKDKPMTTFDPDADSFLSARSIEQLGRFERALDAAGVNGDILFECAKGTIGESAAIEYTAFRALGSEMPDIEAILKGENVRLPNRPEVLYMTVSSVIRQAQAEHASAVAKLINRIADGDAAEAIEVSAFLAFECLTGSAKHLRGVRTSPELMKWLSKFGKYLP